MTAVGINVIEPQYSTSPPGKARQAIRLFDSSAVVSAVLDPAA
jgi:hypothetical protein